MRRAIARGRMLPQSLSTNPRIGQLSLKAALLYPLIWVNCDDQGRVSGNPHEIKYACCPNIDHITKTDIADLLKELQDQGLVKVYTTSKTTAIQMLDWWDVQKLQWAYPSEYPPPEGWPDHLRYHPTPKEIITQNWPPSGQLDMELLPSRLPKELPSKQESDRESSKEIIEKEEERGKRRGRGILPSALGSPSPSPRAPPPEIEISHRLTECFKREWGRVPAESPEKVILREPTAKESAQLRDLAKELSSAGGCPLETIDEAFREVAGQPQLKMHISYVRKVLRAWLGLERGPP